MLLGSPEMVRFCPGWRSRGRGPAGRAVADAACRAVPACGPRLPPAPLGPRSSGPQGGAGPEPGRVGPLCDVSGRPEPCGQLGPACPQRRGDSGHRRSCLLRGLALGVRELGRGGGDAVRWGPRISFSAAYGFPQSSESGMVV
jgi:hypothetical protein